MKIIKTFLSLILMFVVVTSFVGTVKAEETQITKEQYLTEIRQQGKTNTEILIASVTGGLIVLVGVGYWLEGIKKRKSALGTRNSGEEKKTEISSEVVKEDRIPSNRVTESRKYIFNQINKVFLSIIAFAVLTLGTWFSSASMAMAQCPVCLVGVGAGLGLAQYLHIDDSITGVWLGAMIVWTTLWTIEFMNKRKWNFKFRDLIIWVLYIGSLFYVLYAQNFITNHYEHVILGLDKLIIGPILGIIFFYAADLLNKWLKKRNNEKVYFPFQKVVLPIGSLLILTIFFYFLVYYIS